MNTKETLPQGCQHCTAECSNKEIPKEAAHLPWNYNLYQHFPIKIARHEYAANSPMFEGHWHEEIQFLYFEKGEAEIFCDTKTYTLTPGNILIINSNEIHYGLACNAHVIYHMIKPGANFLASSQPDLCQVRYIRPLLDTIRFQNYIAEDLFLAEEIKHIIRENAAEALGYELAVKAHVYRILVHLLRHYQLTATSPEDLQRQQKTLHQLRSVLSFMDEHYSEAVTLHELSSKAHMSSQYFCRLFRKLTGKSPMDYINCLRINQAATLLTDTSLNISEIALRVGFDDSNYFSRIFKKYKNISPSDFRK